MAVKPKLMFVLGTRPEVIKLAPVIIRFRSNPDFIVHVCSTGQHREMPSQAFDAFQIEPDRELGVMTDDQPLASLSSRSLDALDEVYRAENPSFVFVQGDTTTAMTATLGSYYLRIPVGHVEAGLRTENKFSPFPPVHYNPNVRDAVMPLLGQCENVHLTDPFGYVDFSRLMAASYLILTDSGRIQEEAPSLGRPVLVLRDMTERPEGIAAGNAILVGTRTEEIVRQAMRLWRDTGLYESMAEARNPYGDGNAADRIHDVVAALVSRCGRFDSLLEPAAAAARRMTSAAGMG